MDNTSNFWECYDTLHVYMGQFLFELQIYLKHYVQLYTAVYIRYIETLHNIWRVGNNNDSFRACE